MILKLSRGVVYILVEAFAGEGRDLARIVDHDGYDR